MNRSVSLVLKLIFISPLVTQAVTRSGTVECKMVQKLCYITGSFDNLSGLSLVLDTGSSYSVLDSSKADLLGLTPFKVGTSAGPGNNGDTTYKLFNNVSISFDGIELKNQLLVSVPFDYVSKGVQYPTDGTLGSNVFMNYVIQFNYQKSYIKWIEPADHVFNKSKAIALEIIDNVPFVEMEVSLANNKKLKGKFLVDTGQKISGILFSKPFQVKHPELLTEVSSNEHTSEAVGGKFTFLKGKVPSLRLGNQTLENIESVYLLQSTGVYANPDIAGGIGPDVLDHFKVTFDYSRKIMILE